MKVSDIMTREVEVIGPKATLQEAAEKMKALNVGMLPVCDGERLIGVLTDRDITLRGTVEGSDPTKTTVADIITPEVVYCFEDQDSSEVAALMQKRQIRRLIVLNRDKQLVGVVSLGDLAVQTRDEELAGKTLERVSEPSQLDLERR
jgi:CBS domain-containing protein